MQLYMLINPLYLVYSIETESESVRKRTPGERDPVRATFLRGELYKTKKYRSNRIARNILSLERKTKRKKEKERKKVREMVRARALHLLSPRCAMSAARFLRVPMPKHGEKALTHD